MPDRYSKWFVQNSAGEETPLDAYQKEPDKYDSTFGGDYKHTLHHLLNHAVHTLDVEKVRILLTKYGANPNDPDINRYCGQALFITVFKTLKNHPGPGDLDDLDNLDKKTANDEKKKKCDEILREFVKNGASYTNTKTCFPFYSGRDDDIKTLTSLLKYVLEEILEIYK